MPDPQNIFNMGLELWVLQQLAARDAIDPEELARRTVALRERAAQEQIDPAGREFDQSEGSPMAFLGPDGVVEIADQTRPTEEIRRHMTRRYVEDALAQQLENGLVGSRDSRTGDEITGPSRRMGAIAAAESDLGGPANLDLEYLAKLMAVMQNTGKGRLGLSPKSAIDLTTGEGGVAEPSVLEAMRIAKEGPSRNFWQQLAYMQK